MQLGMIGLGRMGGEMVRRLLKGGHQCVVFDRSPKAVQALTQDKAVGASSLAAGHLTLVPELQAELARLGRPDIMVVVGGVIPPEDFKALQEMGVAAIFTPGAVIPESAIVMLERLNELLGYAQEQAAQ